MGRQLKDHHPAPGEPRPQPVGSQPWPLGWEPWPVPCPFSRNRTGSQSFPVRVSSFGCVGLRESLGRRGHHLPRAGMGGGTQESRGEAPTTGPSLAPPGRLPGCRVCADCHKPSGFAASPSPHAKKCSFACSRTESFPPTFLGKRPRSGRERNSGGVPVPAQLFSVLVICPLERILPSQPPSPGPFMGCGREWLTPWSGRLFQEHGNRM